MARRKLETADQTVIEGSAEMAHGQASEPKVTPAGINEAPSQTEQQATSVKLGSKTALKLALGAALGIGVAALGYGAALQFPLVPAAAAPVADTAALDDLSAKIAAIDVSALEKRIKALEAALTAQASIAVDTAALQARMNSLEAKLAAAPPNDDLRAELADIRAKLAQADPAPAIKAAIAAQMGAVEQSAQQMVAKVSEAAVQAAELSAMTLLRAALDTGAPYTAAATGLDLPDVLAANADTGIPSLNALKDAFPAAARAGLDAALRSDLGQTWSERAANFLRSQTGARALTPREGNDPDAILSRIEAGLNAADMKAVMTEVFALPIEAKTAMADWISQARLRANALTAFEALMNKGQ